MYSLQNNRKTHFFISARGSTGFQLFMNVNDVMRKEVGPDLNIFKHKFFLFFSVVPESLISVNPPIYS